MDSILYTDGRSIKVTTREFITGEANYLIDGILNARSNLIKAKTGPAILFVIIGLMLAAGGFFHLFNNLQVDDMHIGTFPLTPNRIAALAGAILFLAGIFWIAMSRNKYAVHITTAEGEKEPVVSARKDYISQIVSAINEALNIRTGEIHSYDYKQ
jgi:hypothetical protein